jgi:hypothetical protein
MELQFQNSNLYRFNSRGQSLVLLIFALPFVFTALGMSKKFYEVILQKTESLLICRRELLNLQKIQAEGLNNLLKLNPVAQQLRIKRAFAEKSLKTALSSGNPGAIATAEAFREIVLIEQKSLHSKQLFVLHSTWIHFLKINRSLHADLVKLKYLTRLNQIGETRLQVKKTPKNSESPDYLVKKHFSEKQKFTLNWFIPGFYFSQPIALTCSATLVEENFKWNSLLAKGVKP